MPSLRCRAPSSCSFQARSLQARLAASACALAFILTPAQLAAQEGAAAGMATAQEQVDLPPPRDPVATDEAAQDLSQEPEPVLSAAASDGQAIDFEAQTLSFDEETDTVTAAGNVVLRSGDRSVRADNVSWNRRSGEILATGRVRFVDENGNQLYSDRVTLTDEFQTGAMEDLLLALRQGGRLAAQSGLREADGTITLSQAAYSACAVTTPAGCDKSPSWRITAERVSYDPQSSQVRFRNAYLELFGARILPLPGLSIRTDGGAVAGFLVPDLRISESNGVEVSGSYYWRLAENRDLTASAYLFTGAPPMVSAQYRQLADKGAFQITGYATHSSRISTFTGAPTSERDPRGYVFANGRFQFSPEWSLTGSLRAASDRTFLRRYDISRDDRLRSMVELERIDRDSYLSIAGWATQTLRLGAPQGQVPLALPAIDYRKRLDDPLLGGKVELQANSLAILRQEGQDTQRAFARARWDLRRITGLGQVVQLTGLLRGDVYHSDENLLTPTPLYRGEPGWQGRGIALAAVDVSWPLVGEFAGGEQVFTPRVQLVATPPIRNLAIPNEDARAIDLEDSNLFALNRFPGYDRVEDGVRLTYGFDWQLRRPGWAVKSTLGQSYRLARDPGILIDGTGLSERVSDMVGRTEVRFRDFVKFTHRFRLDKDSLAIRRNEIDATVGSARTYAEIGYLRLNRDITEVEDLQDREELRAAVRVAFLDYWSVFGSGVFNLTDQAEDPTFASDGFEAIRTRLGVAYQDDCIEMGLTWRRDYVSSGDAERGDTFQLYFSLRNLGFR
ncbi:LPS-assembly protein LptD [Qipengyuania sp. SM2507]